MTANSDGPSGNDGNLPDDPTQTTKTGCVVAGSISRLLRADKVEIARRAFGDALAMRVNMSTRLGDVPVQTLREAMADALEAINV